MTTFQDRKEAQEILKIVRRHIPIPFNQKGLEEWWESQSNSVQNAYRAAYRLGGLEQSLIKLVGSESRNTYDLGAIKSE